MLKTSAVVGSSREADAGHLENGLVLGLDALQEAGLREGELGGGSLQVVVGLGLGHPLHKLRQVALHNTSRQVSIQAGYRQKHAVWRCLQIGVQDIAA